MKSRSRFVYLQALRWWAPLLAISPISCLAQGVPGSNSSTLLQEKYTQLPLAFEKRQNGDKEEYVSRGQGYTLALRNGKAFIGVKPVRGLAAAVSLEFAGGRTPKAVPGDELPGKVNLIYGNDPKKWQLGLPTYGKLTYDDVYPGIDVVYYGNQHQIEFDLMVKPGADPEAIRLKLGGAEKLSIDGSGALDLGESAGGLRIVLPQIYQEVNGAKKRVPGRYAIVGRDEVAFRIDPWDRTRPLVIDPSIVYSTLFGGGLGNNAAVSIALDSGLNIVITGGTFSADFPTLNPAQKSLEATSGLGDVFVSKINAGGTAFIYSTYLGGSTNGVNLSRVAVDSAGAAWVSGYTYSRDVPLVNAVQTTLGTTNGNAYVARLNSTGALTFSTYLGGTVADLGTGMAVDSSNNGYVSGWTQSPDFPTTAGALQTALKGTENAFVAKFSAQGALLYSTLLGSGATYGQAVAADSSGSAYVTGNTNASAFPGAPKGGAQSTYGGGNNDAFVAKLNPGGTALTYFTYLGGAGTENGIAIALDSSLNAYIAGTTGSAGLAAALKTSGAYATLPGGSSGYVAKLSPGGSAFSYFTYLGGNRTEGCCGLVLDKSVPPNVYLSGSTDSTNFPNVMPLQTAFHGNETSLFSSTNSGSSFSPFDSNIPAAVSSASINPAGTSAVVLTEAGIYRTVNGGASWTQESFQAIPAGAAGFIARSPVAPGTTLYATAHTYQPFFQYTAFQSTDDGVTWKTMGALPSYGFGLLADPLTANTVYEFGSSSPYVFKSTDGGLTWNPAATGLPTAANVVSMTSTSDGSLYAGGYLANFSNGLGVYKSTNQGASWTAVNTGLGTPFSGFYALSASGTTVYLAAGNVYETTNGGASWAATAGGNIGAKSVSVSPTNPSVLYVLTNSGTILESGNSGASWSPPATGLPSNITHPLVDPSNSAHVLVFDSVNEAGFVTKLNGTGSALIWSTYLGGTSPTYANAVATDGAGNVFVTGSTVAGAGFPVTLTDLPSTTNTNTNAFLIKISDATAACSTLTVSPGSALAPQNGGMLTFSVVAPSGCAWIAGTGGSLWAVPTSGTSGNGSGFVTVQTSSNSSGATRMATFSAGSQTVTITQPSKTCAFSLDKSSYPVPAAGGAVSAILTATAGCPWAVTNSYSSIVKITSNPTGSGNATIGMTVGANFTDSKPTYSLAVGTASIQISQGDSPLTITTGGSLGTFPIGQDQINLNASGGSGNYVWTVASGSVPPGLNIGQAPFSSTPQIALEGIATTPGNYSFSLTVNDGNTSVTQPFTLKITPLTVKDINLPDGFIGTPFSYTLTALNSTGTATFKLTSSMPTWLKLSAGGVFSGTPTAPGHYNIDFSVSDSVDTTYRGLQLNVFAVNITTPGAVPNATQGVAYSTKLAASGGSGGYQYAMAGGQLPQGLSLGNDGTISGPLTNAGTGVYSFNVTVTDSAKNSYQKTMSIDVVGSSPQEIQITLGTFTDASLGDGYGFQISTCCGGTAPFTWTATGLPAGMSIRFGSGVTSDYVGPGWGEIWGVASTAGTYNVTVTVTDKLGASASLTFPLHVSVLGLTCCGLPNGTINSPYSATSEIIGGSGSYTVKQIAGLLPDGLTLNTAAAVAADFTVSGVPLESGFFCPVGFEVTDSSKNTLAINNCLGINNAPGGININNYYNLGSVNPGNYSFQFSACCVANYIWSAAPGSLPAGLTLSAGGLLHGTVSAGTYTFLVKAADALGMAAPGFRQFTLDVTPITITTNSLNYGNVGTEYTTAFTATGGTGTLTWSVVYGNYLPPGLSLAPDGTLSGKPTGTGFFFFGITVSDTAGHTATRNYGLSIYAAGQCPTLLITSGPDLGTWTLGTDIIALNASGGCGTFAWSLVSGSLPPGLSLGVLPNNGGQLGIVGVATTANKTPYSFTLSVTDGHTKVNQAFTLKITTLTLKDNYNLPPAFVGKAYSYTFTPLNNAGAVKFTPNGPLPGTLMLSVGGMLAGTAPAGFYNINFSVFDGTDTINRGYSLAVFTVDIGTPGVLPNGTQGGAYSQVLSATGGAGGYVWSANCCLPGGLSLSAGGTISGPNPAGPGKFNFSVTVSDSNHASFNKQMSITIIGIPPALARLNVYGQTGAWDDAVTGNQYSGGIGLCCGGTGPFTWTATGLPAGMSIRSGTGNESGGIGAGDAEIWGTPTVPGSYKVTITAKDATGATVTQTFPFRVSVLDLQPYTPNGTVNVPYDAPLYVLGGIPNYAVTQAGGQLPAGVSLNTAGLGKNPGFSVAGTPAENGTFGIVFRATDGNGDVLVRTNYFNVNNAPGAISINNNGNLGQIPVNTNYNYQIPACCVSSYMYSKVSGTLPPGIGLSPGGQVNGKATTAGTYTFLVKAADAADVAAPGYRQFTLTVTQIQITSNGLPFGVMGTVYTPSLAATGGTGTLKWSPSTVNDLLPPGVTLGANGTFAGTPTATGQYGFNVTVTDAANNTATRFFSISVYPPGGPPLASATNGNLGTIPMGQQGINLNGFGGTGNYTWSLASGTLPKGLNIAQDPYSKTPQIGLEGIASAAGTYAFSLKLSDGKTSVTQAFTVKVTALTLKDINLPDGFANTAYTYTFTALNNAGPVKFTSTNPLPGTMMLSAGGVLSGTAPAGNYNIGFSIFDGTDTVYRGSQLNVYAVNLTTPGVLPNATQGVAYSAMLAASGGTSGYKYQITGGNPPQGLSLSAGGAFSQSTTVGPGVYGFYVTVTDSSNNFYRKAMSIDVVGAVPAQTQITLGSINDAVVGNGYGFQIPTCCGGTAPFTWTATGLPSGLSIRSGSGVTSTYIWPGWGEIWGVATTPGTYNVTVTVTDKLGASSSLAFPLHVSVLNLAPCCGLPNGTIGTPYSSTSQIIGGSGSYTVKQIDGSLPDGVTLKTAAAAAGNFTVSGTPLENAFFCPEVFEVTDSLANTLTTNYCFAVNNAAGGIGINNGPNLGSPAPGNYSQQLSACCVANYIWSAVPGSLPAGLTLSAGGLLHGTVSAGIYTFLVKAADAAGVAAPGYRQFTLNVTPLEITTNSLAYGNVGTEYTTTFTATGGTGTLTWSVVYGNYLPPGLSLAAGGTLSGKPTATGQYFFAVTVADTGGHVATRSYGMNIYVPGGTPPLQITTNGNLGTISIGQQSFNLNAFGGTGNYTWSLASGALPKGLNIAQNPFNSTPQPALVGIASAAGTYTFSLNLSDGKTSVTQPFTVKVTNLRLKDINLPDGFAGTAYTYTFTALNNAGPVKFTSTNPLPGTMMLSAGGVLSGTAPAGSYNINFSIFDGTDTVYRGSQLNVHTVNLTTPGVLPNATQGVAYSATLAASGGTGPYMYAITGGNPPQGLSLSKAGAFSQSTTVGPGVYGFYVTVTDSVKNSYQKAMSIDVVGDVPAQTQITLGLINDAVVGNGYGYQIPTCCGGTAPFTWTATGLPPGMSIRWGSGVTSDYIWPGWGEIWGVATTPGNYTVTATVTDKLGASSSLTFPLHVSVLNLAPCCGLPNGTINSPYSSTTEIIGGSGSYTVAQIDGSLPDGIALKPAAAAAGNFTVAGTPLENGFFCPEVFEVKDSLANTFTANYCVNINNAAGGININNGPDLGSVAPGNYSQQLSACCVANYIWSIAGGSPPSGLGISPAGQLQGPVSAGSYTFLVKAADALGVAPPGFRQFTLNVTPIQITTNSLAYGNVGTAYSATFAATGGTGTLTWSLVYGNYSPPGLTLMANGTLSGKPTVTGQYSFGVTVSDTGGHTTIRYYGMNVYAPGGAPPLDLPLGPDLGNVAVGPGQQMVQLAATGGTPPYHYSLTPGTMPIVGLRVQDGQPLPTNFPSFVTGGLLGLLGPGSYSTSIRVTDSKSVTFDRAIHFTVLPIDILTYNGGLPKALVNTAYSFQFTAYGGSGTYIWSGSAGSTINSATGLLSGKPQAAGSFNFSVCVADAAAPAASICRGANLTVDPFAITDSPVLPNATAGTLYSHQFSAPGCGTSCNWNWLGVVPPGFTFSNSGLLSGTFASTGGGELSLNIQASGSGGATQKQFTLIVQPTVIGALSITVNSPVPSLILGENDAIPLVATGGKPPYTFTLASGTLPPGMSLLGPGETIGDLQPGFTYFAGRPMKAGLYDLTIKVADSASHTATQAFAVQVAEMAILYQELPTGSNPLVYSSTYSQPMLVVGGTGDYTSWKTAAPIYPGLSANPATGAISGAPTTIGPIKTLWTVTDSASNTVSGFVRIDAASQNKGQAIIFGPLANQNLNGSTPPPLSATASSGLTVTFTSNSMPVCTVTGVFLTLVAGGTCSITASQLGNGVYAPATPVTQIFYVVGPVPVAQTITFGPLGNLFLGSTPPPLSATASSGLPVSFAPTIATETICTVSGVTVTLLKVGTCSIVASRAGNVAYAAAVSVTQSFTISADVLAYATGENANSTSSTFGTLDLITGAYTQIATVGYFLSDLAVAPGGTVYVLASPYSKLSAQEFGTINPTTGAVTSIAPLTVSLNSMAFRSDGTLFSTNFTGSGPEKLYTVNPSTGAATFVANLSGANANDSDQLRFIGNTAYTTDYVTPSGLYTINLATGAGTLVGGTGLNMNNGLGAVIDGQLVDTASVGAGAQIFFIDPATGAATPGAKTSESFAFDAIVQPLFTQTISFGPPSNVTLGVAPFALSATASSGLAVSFASATPPVCTVIGNIVTIGASGPCKIIASRAGNADYAAAASVTQTFTVSP